MPTKHETMNYSDRNVQHYNVTAIPPQQDMHVQNNAKVGAAHSTTIHRHVGKMMSPSVGLFPLHWLLGKFQAVGLKEAIPDLLNYDALMCIWIKGGGDAHISF